MTSKWPHTRRSGSVPTPGLSQPGYGLLGLSAACREGCGRPAHLGLRAVLGGAGAKLLLGRASRTLRRSQWSKRPWGGRSLACFLDRLFLTGVTTQCLPLVSCWWFLTWGPYHRCGVAYRFLKNGAHRMAACSQRQCPWPVFPLSRRPSHPRPEAEWLILLNCARGVKTCTDAAP